MFSTACESARTRSVSLDNFSTTTTSRRILAGRCATTCENSPAGSCRANREVFTVKRVTLRDVADFRDHLRREKGQAVASVNRCLVSLRRYFAWLMIEGQVESNPPKAVKELRRQELAPKGLDRSEVRRLLREVELAAGCPCRCHLLSNALHRMPGKRSGWP